jgi:Photosynthesis system II assembly factor YCF48/Putative zinc-finger
VSRDRDQQLDRALKQELRAMSTPAADHIDPETLAAWADGGLDATAMASIESHVSSCPRCQAIAGVMTRSGPVVAVEPRRWFRLPVWWIPIAAGAAAVTIWMVVPQQREIATAPPSAPAAVESSPVPAPAGNAITQRQAQDLAPSREDRRERAASTEKARDKLTKLQDAAPEKKEAGALAAAPPAAAAPSALQETMRMAPAPLEISSSNASRRWRVVAAGIERTEDGGLTWALIRPSTGEIITGGVAPTGSICWLIGRSGIVLVTSDGASFARVPLHEAIDVTSVTATDARNATVTTVDGRRFRTDDAGRTWRQN